MDEWEELAAIDEVDEMLRECWGEVPSVEDVPDDAV